MRSIQDYLDAAIERQELGSDRQLSRKLGLSDGSVSQFRTGKTLPAPETMVTLARLSGVDEQVALIELAFMAAKDEETKSAYEKILRRIVSLLPATLFGLALFHPDKAFASQINDIAPSMPVPESVSGLAIIMYIM